MGCSAGKALKVADRSTDDDNALGHKFRALSVHHLSTDFMADVKAKGLTRASTIHDIAQAIIMPKGAKTQCPRDTRIGAAYVDCVHGCDHVGMATHMLSYTWNYSCGDIVDALVTYCASEALDPKREAYVWMCCFCINQWRVQEQGLVTFEQFESAFADRVKHIGKVLALMAPWDDPGYMKRVWCVFELSTALEHTIPLQIIMPPQQKARLCNFLVQEEGSLTGVWERLTQIRVENATATFEHDRDCIMKLIRSRSGGAKAVDAQVRDGLRLWFGNACANQLDVASRDTSLAPAALAQTYRRVGYLLFYLGNYAHAIKVQQQGVTVMTDASLSETVLVADLLKGIGVAKLESRDLDGSMETLNRSLQLYKSLGSLETDQGARLLMWLGVAHVRKGDWKRGLATLKDAKRIRVEIKKLETPEGAQLLMHLAAVQALEDYDQARRIFLDTGSQITPKMAQLIGRIGSVKLFCKDFDGAKEAFDEETFICNELGDSTNAALAAEMSGRAARRAPLSMY